VAVAPGYDDVWNLAVALCGCSAAVPAALGVRVTIALARYGSTADMNAGGSTPQ
jgi:hypothetical protein